MRVNHRGRNADDGCEGQIFEVIEDETSYGSVYIKGLHNLRQCRSWAALELVEPVDDPPFDITGLDALIFLKEGHTLEQVSTKHKYKQDNDQIYRYNEVEYFWEKVSIDLNYFLENAYRIYNGIPLN